jgi:preprotein translocase subunit SecF
MKTLLVVAVLLLVGIVGLGFYQGWFHISTDGTEQKSSTTITVDKDKMRADGEAAKEKVQGFGHEATENQEATEDTKDVPEKAEP